MQAEGYSAPTAHNHLPIPRTLGLIVISISERCHHAHSQGHPCLQLFAKSHQTSIGKDVRKDLFAERKKRRETEKGGKEKKNKEMKERTKIHTSFCEEKCLVHTRNKKEKCLQSSPIHLKDSFLSLLSFLSLSLLHPLSISL